MSSYNLSESRNDDQLQRMKELTERNVCFLCIEHVQSETSSPVLFESEHWYIKYNDYPYVGTKTHFMLVPKQHFTRFDELNIETKNTFTEVIDVAVQLADNPIAYSISIRNGAMELTGATVEHLHVQFMVPDPEYDKAPSTKVKLMSFPRFIK